MKARAMDKSLQLILLANKCRIYRPLFLRLLLLLSDIYFFFTSYVTFWFDFLLFCPAFMTVVVSKTILQNGPVRTFSPRKKRQVPVCCPLCVLRMQWFILISPCSQNPANSINGCKAHHRKGFQNFQRNEKESRCG